MGRKIIFSPQAAENPEAAVRVGNALIDRVAILQNFPLVG